MLKVNNAVPITVAIQNLKDLQTALIESSDPNADLLLIPKVIKNDNDLLFWHLQLRFDLSSLTGLTKVTEFKINYMQVEYLLAMHYLYKVQWDNSHKFPINLNNNTKKSIRIFAEYLNSILDMCLQCHSSDSMYDSGTNWFFNIVLEMKERELFSMLGTESLSSHSKDAWITAQSKKSKDLRDGKNPFERGSHIYRLIETALPMQKQSKKFRQYWVEFKSARSTYVQRARDSSHQVIFEKDGLPYISTGSGHGAIVLPGYPINTNQSDALTLKEGV